jgi:hypothetical protein
MNVTCSNLLHSDNMPLLRSFGLLRVPKPPAHAGGYKDFAPTELGRATFKRAQVEDVSGGLRRLL